MKKKKKVKLKMSKIIVIFLFYLRNENKLLKGNLTSQVSILVKDDCTQLE